MEQIAINSVNDLKFFAEKVANEVDPPAVFFLIGELGAGKTSFVQFFARAHGVKLPVRSPTFIIHHEYDGIHEEKIHHLDLYRLHNSSELHELKISGSLTAHSYILIEWADKFLDELREMFKDSIVYTISFEVEKDNKRTISIEKR